MSSRKTSMPAWINSLLKFFHRLLDDLLQFLHRFRAFVVLFLVFTTSAVGLTHAINTMDLILEKKPIEAPDGRRVSAIPTETENWRQIGIDEVLKKDIVATLGTENYVSRRYIEKNPEGERPRVLDLHLAYYTGKIDAVPHVPDRCFIGGGLKKASSNSILPVPMDTSGWLEDQTVEPEFAGEQGRIYTVRLPNRWSEFAGERVRLPREIGPESPIRMTVSEFSTADGAASLYAGYFFVANGGVEARAEGVRTLAFDLTNEYAYYLKVQVTGQGLESAGALAEATGDLVGELLGDILKCSPDWIEVRRGNYPTDSDTDEVLAADSI